MENESIYGKITEHPEYPITDERRFTVEIKLHKPVCETSITHCDRCGFKVNTPCHIKE